MSDDAITQITRRLGRYEAIVAAGLAFIVIFAVSVSGVLFWNTYQLGKEQARSVALDSDMQNVLCNLKRESAIRLKVFAVDSVGIMPEKIRAPLELSYRATLASFAGLDCR